MIIRFFSRFCPIIPFRSHPRIVKNCAEIVSFKNMTIPEIVQPVNFAEKGDEVKNPPKKEAKKQIDSLKMPGMIHPEVQNEEGYFQQKTSQQLEEIKRKPPETNKADLANPEKKE